MKIGQNLKVFFILIIIASTLFVTWRIYQATKPINTIYFEGVPVIFRQDIREADKIPVFPNEEFIRDMFWDYKLYNVTILFKPGTPKTNGLYQLQVFELTYKMITMYKNADLPPYFSKTISAQEVESYEDIVRKDNTLEIILVPPEFANRTAVVGGGNKVFIYGETDKGFDLAVIKTLLVAMGAEIQ